MKHIDVIVGSMLFLFGFFLLTWTTRGIPLHLWDKLNIYWPVIIIIFGIYFLLCSILNQKVSALIAVFLVCSFGVFMYAYNPLLIPTPAIKEFKEYISEGYEDISHLEVDLDMDVGKANIYGGSKDIYDGLILHSDALKVDKKFFKWDNKARLIIKTTWNKSIKRVKKDNIWSLHFNNTIPILLDLKTNLSSVSMDLTSLKVSTAKIDAEVSLVNLTVGKRNSDVVINCNVSSINIVVPKDVSAVVSIDKTLSDVEIKGFTMTGNSYTTPNLTDNPVQIRIRGNLSKISLTHNNYSGS